MTDKLYVASKPCHRKPLMAQWPASPRTAETYSDLS